MADKREVREIWNLLCVAYPNYIKDMTAEQVKRTLQLYELVWGNLPGEVLKQVAIEHIRASRFFPTAAELVQPTLELLRPLRETALEAWGIVQGVAAKAWYYYDERGQFHAPEPFANPITQRIVDALGGLKAIGTSDNTVADRARFIEAYDDLVARETAEARLLPETLALRNRQLSQIGAAVNKQLTGGTHDNDN